MALPNSIYPINDKIAATSGVKGMALPNSGTTIHSGITIISYVEGEHHQDEWLLPTTHGNHTIHHTEYRQPHAQHNRSDTLRLRTQSTLHFEILRNTGKPNYQEDK
jgi:hypothetical protein